MYTQIYVCKYINIVIALVANTTNKNLTITV